MTYKFRSIVVPLRLKFLNYILYNNEITFFTERLNWQFFLESKHCGKKDRPIKISVCLKFL